MGEIEISSMSSRGQIVIPQDIRENMHLKEGAKFIVMGADDTIVFKRIKTQSWEEITVPLQKAAKESGLKEKDVVGIVHRARTKKK